PTCDGNDGSLTEFVPLATAQTLKDGENPLVFSGHTDEAGNFTIDGLAVDTYDLGFQAEYLFTDNKRVWTGTVGPTTASIDAPNTTVSGVTYNITDVSCSQITP
ncbi:MAG: hypothetical protein LJF04_00270, partial [Gemmatimonadetes bacterium]|nr:hypothetical protein [Gemmatimonadota bacterium]